MCRHCNQLKSFHNRCKLLSHIRSHAFKTATINVSDLKVDPLPSKYFDSLAAKHCNTLDTNQEKTVVTQEVENAVTPKNAQQAKVKKINKFCCVECKKEVISSSQIYKDRAKHLMQYTNMVHSCPVCLFAMPTICGLKTHLRLHTSSPPYYCPECGIILSKRMIQYPYTHDCEGFRMMRATARYKCSIEGCYLFHPNEYKAHMKNNHIKKVYKCPMCVVACFNETTIAKHLTSHQTEAKAVIFFQCEMCPGRLVLQTQMDNHLRGHITNSAFVYPCWVCGKIFREVRILLKHHSNCHSQVAKSFAIEGSGIKQTSDSTSNETDKTNTIYRVVKRCDKCKKSFTYKCKYEQIAVLPNECPYKCSALKESTTQNTTEESQIDYSPVEATIKCHLCKQDVSENWEELKRHYASDHKSFKCLDAKLILNRINVKKYNRKKRRAAQKRLKRALKNRRVHKVSQLITSHPPILEIVASPSCSSNPLACKKCGRESVSKEMLEEHLMGHRDPGMAYQCMECGQCFAVKPSFTTHLLVQHGISDVEEYINMKHCYNPDALLKNNFTIDKCEIEEPLHENQCQICREQFDTMENLEKHFRVHGMAFLKKNSSGKTNSP